MKYLEIAPDIIRGENWDGIRDSNINGCIQYDLRNLPIIGIDDNTYNGIYSEHFIEHLTKNEGIEFFKEMFRILKPGGTIRTVWPSMDFIDFLRSKKCYPDNRFVRLYLQHQLIGEWAPKGIEHHSKQEQCALTLLYQDGDHKHLWYKDELINTSISLGYENVKQQLYNISEIGGLNGIDTDSLLRKMHSTVVEATKPL
jgi:predicted SAM-dependent methyltransferase